MTPGQFHLLGKRHREARVHTELVHAYTTAAAINYSYCSPETPVSVVDFMPNHSGYVGETEPELTEEELEEKAAFQLKVLQLAAEMKQESGPLYEEICLGRKPGWTPPLKS